MDDSTRQLQERFLELFQPTRERLWRFIRALTHADRTTVDEIMSETVFRVYQRVKHLRDEQAFRSYCFTIARRIAWENAKRARRSIPTDPSDIEEQRDPGSSPETSTDISLLYDMLSELRPKLRETLVLFEIADMSLEEIRTIQGGTLSGVKSRLLRARAQLEEIVHRDRQSLHSTIRLASSTEVPALSSHDQEKVNLLGRLL